MTVDPRTPVIVGVAQVSQRPPADENLHEAPDPIDLMVDAVRNAADDSGATGPVLSAIDSIVVVGGLWRYRNPGALIASALGLDETSEHGPHTQLTTFGGNLPIHATHRMAERVAAGEFDMVVITGGECTLTRRNLAKRGDEPRRREEPHAETAESWGPPLKMGDRTAVQRGGETPRNSYAILDSALRARWGETLDAARDRAARQWASYAAVAAANPHAADRSAMEAEEIRNPTPQNRMVSWPYTKAMCANNTVDQAAALIVCSAERADQLGIAADRRVYPLHCVTASDTTSLLERDEISLAPGLTAAAQGIVDFVGAAAEIDHFDLYSCFPSIVALTVEAFGIDSDQQLTVNGGLAFAGAPLNFAAGQALVAMVDVLRADPASLGLVQGNGGHATKHAFGLYSTDPPPGLPHIDDLGAFADGREIAAAERGGPAVVDGLTVEFEADGPTRAIAIVQFADGARTWATSTETALIARFLDEDPVGSTVFIHDGEMHTEQPAA